MSHYLLIGNINYINSGNTVMHLYNCRHGGSYGKETKICFIVAIVKGMCLKLHIIVIKLIFTMNLVIHGVLVNQHSMIFPLKEVNGVNQCII